MTNKLEEVLKELQESHVLVDREEYERLVEKAKEAELEKIAKFEVGEYYFSYYGIFKVTNLGARVAIGDVYITRTGKWMKDTSVSDEGAYFEKGRKATDEEIKLFKRAEMYHKHGRKLDDLKVVDFVRDKTDGEIYQIDFAEYLPQSYTDDEIEEFAQAIAAGESELYLTLKEAEEAHKKIVGE